MPNVPLIVFSRQDLAAMNALQHFRLDELPTQTVDDRILSVSEHFLGEVVDYKLRDYSPPTSLEISYIVFVSRHSSQGGRPGLHCHVTGNWTSEVFWGGKPEEVSFASPQLLRAALLALQEARGEFNLESHALSLEVTHHGPTGLGVPSVFMELGSEETAWKDETGGLALAKAVQRVVSTFQLPEREVRRLGFGGNHYAARFTKEVLRSDFTLGHMVPKHVLDQTRDEMLLRASDWIRGSDLEWVIDKKGTNAGQKARIRELAAANGIDVRLV